MAHQESIANHREVDELFGGALSEQGLDGVRRVLAHQGDPSLSQEENDAQLTEFLNAVGTILELGK